MATSETDYRVGSWEQWNVNLHLERLTFSFDFCKRRVMYPNNNADLAKSLFSYGETLWVLKRYEEGRLCYAQALTISLHAENSTEMSNVSHALGKAKYAFGDYEKALDYFEQALTIRQRLHSGNNPDTARSLHEVGATHYAFGHYQEAKNYYMQALIMRQALHPRCLCLKICGIKLAHNLCFTFNILTYG